MGQIAFFDLKEEELSVYILEKKGDSCRPKETLSIPVREGHFSIEETFEEMEESYLSLPLSLLDFRILEFPFSDQEKIREVVPFELDGLILGESENVVFDFFITGERNGKYQVMVVYIKKETLKVILERLKALRIDPKVVTSLELASVADDSFSSMEGITNLLLNPKPIPDKDRMDAVMEEIDQPTINLRRGELVYTVDTEKTKKSLKITAILASILVLFFLAYMALKIISTKREISLAKEEIRKTYVSLFPHEKKITNELYQMKAHLKELKEKERLFIGISPLQLLLDLTSASGPGISFHEIIMDRERVVLKGECPSLSSVQKIKSDLERFLLDVNISEAKPFSKDRTIFTITAKGRKA